MQFTALTPRIYAAVLLHEIQKRKSVISLSKLSTELGIPYRSALVCLSDLEEIGLVSVERIRPGIALKITANGRKETI